MHEEFLAYVKQSTDLDDSELMDVIEKVPVKAYPKGTVLLEQGEVANKIYFILKGCIRKYFVDEEGRENTVDFYTENQTAALFNSYTNHAESDHALACVEDCVLIIGDSETEQSFYDMNPALKNMNFAILEQSYGQAQDYIASFKSSSPEDRYKSLLKNRKRLIERVPQHQLASYLGITPESLSRIKKRLAKQSD